MPTDPLSARLDEAADPATLSTLYLECCDALTRVAAPHLLTWLHRADCPCWFLKIASTHPDRGVRATVAAHPSSEAGILKQLALDPQHSVRRALALHPRGPLELLAQDPDPEVRQAVARAAGASPALLRALAHDPDVQVRKAAALHPATPISQVLRLAHQADHPVRAAACLNPQMPRSQLRLLADDPHPQVRQAAHQGLQAHQERLATSRGEELWAELLDLLGPPQALPQPDGLPAGEVFSIHIVSDGYGSGTVSFEPAQSPPGDNHLHQSFHFTFGVPLEPGWLERLGDNSWERLSEIPGTSPR